MGRLLHQRRMFVLQIKTIPTSLDVVYDIESLLYHLSCVSSFLFDPFVFFPFFTGLSVKDHISRSYRFCYHPLEQPSVIPTWIPWTTGSRNATYNAFLEAAWPLKLKMEASLEVLPSVLLLKLLDGGHLHLLFLILPFLFSLNDCDLCFCPDIPPVFPICAHNIDIGWLCDYLSSTQSNGGS